MLQQTSEHAAGLISGEWPNGKAAESARLPSGGLNLKRHIEQIELNLIRQALERSRGVVASAARLLSLRRTTLVEKLRKYRNQNYCFETAE